MCGPAARLVPSLAQCTSDHLTSLCPRDTHGSPPLHPLATQADSTSSADRHLASSLQGRPIYNSLKSVAKSNPYESTCCSVLGAGWEMGTGCLLPFMLSVPTHQGFITYLLYIFLYGFIIKCLTFSSAPQLFKAWDELCTNPRAPVSSMS